MNLEDDFTDIIKKARHGQGLSVADLARKCGLEADRITDLERGSHQPPRDDVEAIAMGLGLRPGPLIQIALGTWVPAETPASVSQVETVLGDIGGYAVKGYVLYDLEAKEAVLIDTGYNSKTMLTFLDEQGLRLNAVCLTHGHADHAGGLDRLLARWPVPVYLGQADRSLAPWLPNKELLARPEDGTTIAAGRLTVECMTTPGHTPGGICYRVTSGAHDICFVGDTLFAGSIGRANPFSLYPAHLDSVRQRVLTLSGRTILFPGHGPATSVVEELEHNPFVSGEAERDESDGRSSTN